MSGFWARSVHGAPLAGRLLQRHARSLQLSGDTGGASVSGSRFDWTVADPWGKLCQCPKDRAGLRAWDVKKPTIGNLKGERVGYFGSKKFLGNHNKAHFAWGVLRCRH